MVCFRTLEHDPVHSGLALKLVGSIFIDFVCHLLNLVTSSKNTQKIWKKKKQIHVSIEKKRVQPINCYYYAITLSMNIENVRRKSDMNTISFRLSLSTQPSI